MSGARNFFNQQEQEMLIKAIEAAEKNTSGEIRIHLANYCFGSEIKAAQKVFKRLKMHETSERNGVLIYIATRSRKIAIVGDEGIHQKLGNEFWQSVINSVIKQFKANSKADALVNCINECGVQLGRFFPLKSDDTNELNNSISF